MTEHFVAGARPTTLSQGKERLLCRRGTDYFVAQPGSNTPVVGKTNTNTKNTTFAPEKPALGGIFKPKTFLGRWKAGK